MKLKKVRYLSPCTEVAGKGREKECSESKSRVLDLEGICWMEEYGFTGWIGARNNGGRNSEVRKTTIALPIVHSISNYNLDKRRFKVIANHFLTTGPRISDILQRELVMENSQGTGHPYSQFQPIVCWL
jgi:hypothetical protein